MDRQNADRDARAGWPRTFVVGTRRRFRALARLNQVLAGCIKIYLKGTSTGDFEEALVALLGKDTGGLSASTIGRKDALSEEHARCNKRDLSAKR